MESTTHPPTSDRDQGDSDVAAPNLTELVAYGPDAVVSRALIDKSAGTVSLFAFDAGQGLSEHRCPYEAAAIILDGAARFTIGATEVTARTGQLVNLPADVPHAVRAEERFKMMLIMIKQ
ncbi:MAG: cupin domain-containing protein [Sedimentisphaerales bacterium]|nr:cupin domain-containing protein [Sedimentisphaerales bacterium]